MEAEKLDDWQRLCFEDEVGERRLDRVERSEIRKRMYEQTDDVAARGSDEESADVDGKKR